MSKKVLILCTGNSCRSIIAQALINSSLQGVDAQSSGVKASGKVNPSAQKILEEKGIWKSSYHSKTLDTLIDNHYDLVVTVCDHAQETCPTFPKATAKLHLSFEDPDGKSFDAFEKSYEDIKAKLLPAIKEFFAPQVTKQVFQMPKGVKIAFSGAVQKNNILKMVENCATGACECMSSDTKAKIQDMQVLGEDGAVTLELSGTMSKAEIEEALAKSKVINESK